MTGAELLGFVQGVGFPAAVAFFVLWRLEGALRHVHEELVAVRLTLEKLAGQLTPLT